MLLSKLTAVAAILTAAAALTACAFDGTESDGDEDVGLAQQGVGGTGLNNVKPKAIDGRHFRRSFTDSYGMTSPTNPDVSAFCKAGTITANGCVLAPEWEDWLADDVDRGDMLKGVAKCAVESTFTIRNADGSLTWPGQWGLYPNWKDHRLNSQEKRERVSACILTLLNGNNQTLNLCIIGPGGSPFSDACSDPQITTREAGFFGDLFASSPKAYVVGPQVDPVDASGRACNASSGTYCCDEDNMSCPHWIVRAGGMLGPDQRCLGFATSGSFTYCTSFYSTREPNRVYNYGFTTFVP